jgi:hypothetical protein
MVASFEVHPLFMDNAQMAEKSPLARAPNQASPTVEIRMTPMIEKAGSRRRKFGRGTAFTDYTGARYGMRRRHTNALNKAMTGVRLNFRAGRTSRRTGRRWSERRFSMRKATTPRTFTWWETEANRSKNQAAKLLVMLHIERMVEDGVAEQTHLYDGCIELRMATGEVLHLLDDVIVRLGSPLPTPRQAHGLPRSALPADRCRTRQ